jgi:fluoroacetyl-CoA thioesterase
MQHIYKEGDMTSLTFTVKDTDTATFESETVHPVYATFALGRDAEWACRQFVLDMKENDEEGIGTFLTITHHSPALLGQTVLIEATVKSIIKHEIICSYIAKVGERIIATGETGQKILKKERLEQLFNSL